MSRYRPLATIGVALLCLSGACSSGEEPPNPVEKRTSPAREAAERAEERAREREHEVGELLDGTGEDSVS
ncbi:MAG: hypothetical protein ACREKN_05520 [Longimicrobiaceae bacterium]